METSNLLRAARLVPCVAIAAALIVACSQSNEESHFGSASSAETDVVLPRFVLPMRGPDGNLVGRKPGTALPQIDAPNQKLLYYGGRVISNVKVYAVNWGPNTNATLKAQIGGFYTAITNSAYMDWLSEYDTLGINGQDFLPGSGQRIGRGSYGGMFTITPSVAGNSIKNSQIRTELAAQIAAGNLPQPDLDANGNVNAIYMFDFPSAASITIDDFGPSAASCVQFCAYHFTTIINGKSVPYGVHPDISAGACAFGCGGTSFGAATSVHSHELIEAVTDTEIGVSDPNAPNAIRPMAWYCDQNSCGEIGDICNGQTTTVAGFTVQKEWSNSAGACIGTATTIICDGSTPAIPGCRACTAADNGVACNGTRAHCETDAANVKVGQCVACTQSSHCASAVPTCKKSAGADDDTCVPTGIGDAGTDSGSDAGNPVDAGVDAGNPLDAGVDAGNPVDAGTDAASTADAGNPVDAGSTGDASAPVDAGRDASVVAHDSGASDSGGKDAGDAAEAGGSGDDSGCGCRAAGAEQHTSVAALSLLGLPLLFAVRRRRRRAQ